MPAVRTALAAPADAIADPRELVIAVAHEHALENDVTQSTHHQPRDMPHDSHSKAGRIEASRSEASRLDQARRNGDPKGRVFQA
jgi:hypothetical protein